MNREKLNARAAWAGLIAGVIVYDAISPEEQTLSEGVDRALECYPKSTVVAIGVTALHLANALPEKVDPIHHFARVLRARFQ